MEFQYSKEPWKLSVTRARSMENKWSGGDNLLAREMYKETRESGGSRHSGWKVQGFAQPAWVWGSALLLDGSVNLAGLFDLPKWVYTSAK